jgi:hypothetical protein
MLNQYIDYIKKRYSDLKQLEDLYKKNPSFATEKAKNSLYYHKKDISTMIGLLGEIEALRSQLVNSGLTTNQAINEKIIKFNETLKNDAENKIERIKEYNNELKQQIGNDFEKLKSVKNHFALLEFAFLVQSEIE